MDFASLMKAELEAKKAKMQAVKSQAGKSWMKQSELKQAELEAKKRASTPTAQDGPAAKKAKQDESPALKPVDGKDGSKTDGTAITKTEVKISDATNLDIMRQLRERNEPIRLFGESDAERRARLQYIKTHESSDERGFRNDFMEAVDKVNEQYLQEFLMQKQQDEETKQREREKRKRDRELLEDVTKQEIEHLYAAGNERDPVFITRSIQYLLMLWEEELDARSPEEVDSPGGKRDTAIYHQTISYLDPLLQKLKKDNGELTDDMLILMTEIFRQMHDRDYVAAADMYLRLAIGNAAWPIGVTMVGIHARTGREKIYSQHVAHVLNDETQRKYIQAMKRLMSLAQRKFPANPSKSVEYDGVKKLY